MHLPSEVLFSFTPLPSMTTIARCGIPQWNRNAGLNLYNVLEDDVKKVKKPAPDSGSGFIIGSDPAARVVHLEHSVRFLQEQHRLMLSGLHAEIEALRERNRDLQFQLIFNKESSPKTSSPSSNDDSLENKEVTSLKREVCRLEREAAAARGEARDAEARALQLQRLVDAQAEKLRELESRGAESGGAGSGAALGDGGVGAGAGCAESRAELRVRLAEAERLVRRLRADADRQRRELQCMKNSLHASLRASGLDGGFGYQNYHFPSLHTADFWREPLREDYNMGGSRGRSTRRPLVLPELTGHQIHRSTIYANNHTRSRANGYENKTKKPPPTNGDVTTQRSTDEPQDIISTELTKIKQRCSTKSVATYPELKIVVTKLIPHGNVTNCVSGTGGAGGASSGDGGEGGGRTRARRHHHRKHATEHT